MKVEREVVVPVFEPIVITIESLEELKWLTAIANTSSSIAHQLGRDLGFYIDKDDKAQMDLWNGISKHMDLIV
jgi:hypothetical protein